jgi:hypothetical protein
VSFTPGQNVVLQEVWQDRVWAARPMTVGLDEDDRVALWFPKGTIWKRPVPPPTHPPGHDRGERLARCLAAGEWDFADTPWEVSTLVLMREGDWHAVWVSWLDDGTQWGWYVNLQEPFRRTRKGFVTMDLALDVVIATDRTWEWKDEDELATFVAAGVFDEALAERLRAEGHRVAARAERNESPFDEPWPSWHPDTAWAPPVLPDDWNVVWR